MKITIVLEDVSGGEVRVGKIDPDVVLDAHLITYRGKTYGYRTTSRVMTSVFRECTAATPIDDHFEPQDGTL